MTETVIEANPSCAVTAKYHLIDENQVNVIVLCIARTRLESFGRVRLTTSFR